MKIYHTFEDFHVASIRHPEINGFSTCKVDGGSELILLGGLRLGFFLMIGAE